MSRRRVRFGAAGLLVGVLTLALLLGRQEEEESERSALLEALASGRVVFVEPHDPGLILRREQLPARVLVETPLRAPESACGKAGRAAAADGRVDERERRMLRSACPWDH